MNELIKVSYESDRPTVSGRELHELLGVLTQYKDWFPRMCEYGFVDGVDFNLLKFKRVAIEGTREVARNIEDHQLTIDMAKELCMIQRNEKGKQARQYFIALEKAWNSPEKIIERALQIAQRRAIEAENRIFGLELENSKQKQIIGELKPKADYVDWILKSRSLVTMTAIAKDYGMSARVMNKLLHNKGIQFKQGDQWFLYQKYQAKGYTHSETVDIIHSDGRPDISTQTKWTQKGRLFLYEALKSDGVLPMIERVKSA